MLWRDTIPENCNWDTLATGIWRTVPERWGRMAQQTYTLTAWFCVELCGNVTQIYISHSSTDPICFRQRWSSTNNFAHWQTASAFSAYPVGAIYISTSSTSPASLFGGSWESIASERVLMGVSSSHGAGSTVSAGLPNISGVLKDLFVSGHFNQSTGVFKRSYCSSFSEETSHSDWLGWADAQFYASDSNSIYGNASTVQPAAYYVYMWQRVA